MHYIQLKIKGDDNRQEELIALLSDRNATGFEQQEGELIAYFDSNTFEEEPIAHLLSAEAYTKEIIEAQNWNAVWESNFQPVIVANFCAIRADFHSPINDVEHELIITPKMSFGTGHHATTYMMIQQMKDIDFTGKRVFDFGTGTGILALLAERLGAASVIATDIDEWSITNALENKNSNQGQHIHIYQSDAVPGDRFDIILANINKNVILQHMPDLIRSCKPNGTIVFSGLLVSDEQEIKAAANKAGLLFKKQLERQNWISLLYEKAS